MARNRPRKELSTVRHLFRELLALGLFVVGEKVNHAVWESYGPVGPPTPMALGLAILVGCSLLILTASLISHAADVLEQTRRLWVTVLDLVGRDQDDEDGDDDEDDGGGVDDGPTPTPIPLDPGQAEIDEEHEQRVVVGRRAVGNAAAGLVASLLVGRNDRSGQKHDVF